MNYKIITILFLSFFNLIFFTWLDAQVNYEPVNNSVYKFLERMSIKGVIRLNEEILPFSRKYISEKIIEIDKVKNKLSAIENDELTFYVKEYSSELKRLKFNIKKYEVKNKFLSLGYKSLGFNKFNRFRLINYDEDKFGFYLDPVFRLSYAKNKNGTSTLWSNGLRMYGHVGNNIGFELQFYDNHTSGYFFNIY